MWQIYEVKVIALTLGGLIGGWKQSVKPVVTTNGEKSAKAQGALTVRTVVWEVGCPIRLPNSAAQFGCPSWSPKSVAQVGRPS